MPLDSMNIDESLYNHYDVISFDLFDTVLLRHVKRPAHVFYFAGLKAQECTGLSPDRFLKIRLWAEKLCRWQIRLFSSREEVSLTDIYRMLGRLLRLDQQTVTMLQTEEMHQEKTLIYPNPAALKTIKSLNEEGKRVVFTSDMYLPFDFVYEVLAELKIIQSQDQLYLSSAVSKRKRTGNLFKYVLSEEKVATNQFFHIGDSCRNDYESAARLGITAVHYRNKPPTLPWLPPIGNTDVGSGLLRQASQQTYQCLAESGENDPIRILGAYVGGPVLFSYVHWLLHEAARKEIKTLYFLARDGQILIRIAQLLCKHYGLDIRLRYLYSSRHSWMLPSLLDYTRLSQKSKFFVFSKGLTLRKLFYRFKVHDLQAPWINAKIQKTGLQLDDPITLLNLKKARHLFTDPDIVRRIRAIGEHDFNLISGYLKQEGLFDEAEYALVDVGWRGSLPRALRRIFLKNNARQKGFTVFFFDLYHQQTEAVQDVYQAFLRETNNPYRALRAEMETIMEVLTAATHESTYGFEWVNGRYQPAFIKENLDAVHRWGLDTLQDTMAGFAQTLLNNPCFTAVPAESLYRASLQNFYAFLNKPTPQIAQKIACFPYTVQQVKQADEAYNVICAPYRLRNFATLLREFNVVRSNDLWIQGSLSLTADPLTRALFRTFYKLISSTAVQRVEHMIKKRMTNKSAAANTLQHWRLHLKESYRLLAGDFSEAFDSKNQEH